jgi:hypothetical protein
MDRRVRARWTGATDTHISIERRHRTRSSTNENNQRKRNQPTTRPIDDDDDDDVRTFVRSIVRMFVHVRTVK